MGNPNIWEDGITQEIGVIVSDNIDHPQHYNYGDIEVIDFIDQVTNSYEGKAAYLAGNVIKYVSRAPHKNGAEDVEKAIWYAKRLADVMETKEDE